MHFFEGLRSTLRSRNNSIVAATQVDSAVTTPTIEQDSVQHFNDENLADAAALSAKNISGMYFLLLFSTKIIPREFFPLLVRLIDFELNFFFILFNFY